MAIFGKAENRSKYRGNIYYYFLDVRQYTEYNEYIGISFRKGGITALSRAATAAKLNTNHVADFADHRSIETTRGYDEISLSLQALIDHFPPSLTNPKYYMFEHLI
eukprot:SAG11_NODE_3086_length_2703_cov_3.373272_2_plen_106_part_00